MAPTERVEARLLPRTTRAEEQVHRQHLRAGGVAPLEGLETGADEVHERVDHGEGARRRPTREGERSQSSLQLREHGTRQRRPRDAAAAALAHADVLPAVEQARELAPGVAVDELLSGILPHERDRDHDRAFRAKDASELRNGLVRSGQEVERLRAQNEVERRVGERQELVGGHIGDAVRVAGNIEADDGRTRRQEILVRPRTAVDVEDVTPGRSELGEHLGEVANDRPQMQVVELRRPWTASAAPDPAQIVLRELAAHMVTRSAVPRAPVEGEANLAATPADEGRAGPKRGPTVAILPWGDVFADWLDRLGVSLEEFAEHFTGSWMFGYADALRRAGVRSVLVCVTERVRAPVRTRHAPTGSVLVFLPRTRAAHAVRGRRLRRHLAPYLATPPIQLARVLRAEGCQAVLCQEYETPRFDLAILLGRLLRLPVFATFQGGDYHESRLEQFVRPLTIGLAEGLIVGSGQEAERLQARYRLAEARIARIFNPIDVDVWRPGDRAAARRELGLPAEAQVVAWHGQVQMRRKGLDVLLEAWSRLRGDRKSRDLRLMLVGTGEDAEALRRTIAARRLDGVELGDRWLAQDELARALAAADAYAFASRHEGFAIAPVEAMACGLPVVAADVTGIPDVLGSGEEHGGVIVPQEDPAALADALGSLLDDEPRRCILAARARERAVTACSLDAVGGRLRSLLVEGRVATGDER
jgi:glycosyltransferase involved in cell wall biosynthesis